MSTSEPGNIQFLGALKASAEEVLEELRFGSCGGVSAEQRLKELAQFMLGAVLFGRIFGLNIYDEFREVHDDWEAVHATWFNQMEVHGSLEKSAMSPDFEVLREALIKLSAACGNGG